MSKLPQNPIIIDNQPRRCDRVTRLIVRHGRTYQYNDDGYLQSKVTPNGTTTYQYER